MVRIPEATVDDIRQNADIVEIISQYLQLRKSGQNHFAHCPFHEDKTPSFSVNERKQLFHCFSCGRGGNVFNFIREIDGLTYPEAIIKTAELINYPLEDSMISRVFNQVNNEESATGKLYSINQLAKEFYHHVLMYTDIGKPALDYLLERGLTEETLIEFEIGFSPAQRNALFIYLSSQDDYEFETEIYKDSGLFSENQSPGEKDFLDRFTNRIIFPIHNERKQSIGFSGRIFKEKKDDSFVQAKYLNTPQTSLFNKSQVLYNFGEAKAAIRREKEAIFFEGYMDVIAAWQAGIKNGIASMGTSLTENQIQMVDRFSDHIVLAFDGDDAGKEAIKRSIDYLSKNTHFSVEIVSFPAGLDPDDYIQKHGADDFKDLLEHGRDTYMSFLMDYHRRSVNIKNDSEQIQYIEAILKELTKVDSLVERELYFKQLSEEFDISLETLKSQFETVMQSTQTEQLAEYKEERRRQKYQKNQTDISYQNKAKYTLSERAERMLLNRLFYHEEAWIYLSRLDPDFQFNSEDLQLIYILFESYREKDFESTNTEGFLDYLQEDHLKRIVAEIFLIDLGELKESEIIDNVEVINNLSPTQEKLSQKMN
ncbi:MAG: DNA primase, partial [Atopostipes suicloacalis]|nr:DNA primase [Atopostipes suicloacalis]